ncbi:MAG: TadE/TadG family type IV pilus assembly protein, partial [Acidimicrobiales bacterium]
MYRRSLTRRHNGERERGSVLVELTMVLPLLITLVLGMMEMGMAWRDQQTIVQASRQGARVGSHLGDDATADQQAIEAALAVLDADQLANIRRIIVYKVTTADGAVPPNCLAV